MALNDGQSKILRLVDEKSGHTVSDSVISKAVIEDSGLPAGEVSNYFSQLEGLGLITKGIKIGGVDYIMLNMTKEGLNETSQDHELR